MYTAKELSSIVLKENNHPMTPEEIWDYAVKTGLAVKSTLGGKTPWATVGAQIYTEIKGANTFGFYKASKKPTRFFLNELQSEVSEQVEDDSETDIPEEDVIKPTRSSAPLSGYSEADLHQFLVSFVNSDAHFLCHCKTIDATKSSSRSKNENRWRYPDIVGVHYPFDDEYSSEVCDLFNNIKQNTVSVYSFELKKKLDRGTVREKYFQAISNSSWAHEGYIVAAEIDPDVIDELRNLNRSFGIGVIKLSLKYPAQSEILFQSRHNDILDESMVDRLSDNPDFKRFIISINQAIKSGDVNMSKYDKVMDLDDLAELAIRWNVKE